MNIGTVLLNIAWILLGFIVVYLKTRTNIIEMAQEKIIEAEKEYASVMKAGSIKQEFVVSFIFDKIPAPMRVIFTKETIRGLVQATFDAAQKYAYTQLDKIFNKDKDKIEEK